MGSQKTEIKACVRSALEELADQALLAEGFRRKRNSLIYHREINDAMQRIEVYIEHHPTDRRDAAAAVYPYLTVAVDDINKLVESMVKGDRVLGGNFDRTLHQPIDFTSHKKDVRARWFIFQPESVPPIVEAMRDFVLKWTIPFLNKYTTVEAVGAIPLQTIDFRSDDHDVHTQPEVLRVVAAKVLCGRLEEAMSVMERWFGRAGPRKRYRDVFEYIAKAMEP
jgi:hypothetical protein